MMIWAITSAAGYSALGAVNVLQGVVPHRLLAHPLLRIFGWPVYLTNDLCILILAALLMLGIFPYMARRLRRDPVPTGFINFLEAMLDFLRREIFDPMLGRWSEAFTPYLWTCFFLILFCDLLGILPINEILNIINYYTGLHIPEFWGGPTGNVTVTAVLALSTFVVVHTSGVAEHIRIARRGRRSAPAAGSPPPAASPPPRRAWPLALIGGVILYFKGMVPSVPLPWLLGPIFFVLELLSTMVKPLSLCMRLFAVMMSGPLVIAVFVSMIFMAAGYLVRGLVGLPVILFGTAFEALHLLEAFLQAFIFTLLSAAYIAEAIVREH